MPTHGRGFTLIEILIALCIAWLLAQMALPGLLGFTSRNDGRLALQATLGALDRARSSAVMLGKDVGVCMLTEQQLCSDDWHGDYLAVFVDQNRNRQRDDDEDIIFQQAWPGRTVQLRWGNNWLNQPFITYQATGSIVSNGTLYIEDVNGKMLYSLVISKAGRARIEASDAPRG
jgi:type IV fimbrial biogenesis protein FimT